MKKILKNVYVVKEYQLGDLDCCVYLVDTKSDDGLVLIDAGLYLSKIKEIEKYGFELKDIKHCLITHSHIDHFGACHELKKINTNIKFYAHKLDINKIEQKEKEEYIQQYYADYKYEPVKVTNIIKEDGVILKFGQLEFKCIHIPGHTPGSLAYLLETEQKRILFGGDLPGLAIVLEGSNLDDYVKSMPKLYDLKIDILCEGHEKIIQPAEKVLKFIKGYVKFNQYLHIIVKVNPLDSKVMLDLIKLSCELEFYENALDFCNYLIEIDPNNKEGHYLLNEIEKHKPAKYEFIKGFIKANYRNNI
ncbi:MAG: MBL fold metallo-hydrolase [Candidatus Hodarchaeota archaeon]